MWPKDAPCVKLYSNGKYAVKGPSPEGYVVDMQELYEKDAAYQQWLVKLETCQPFMFQVFSAVLLHFQSFEGVDISMYLYV